MLFRIFSSSFYLWPWTVDRCNISCGHVYGRTCILWVDPMGYSYSTIYDHGCPGKKMGYTGDMLSGYFANHSIER